VAFSLGRYRDAADTLPGAAPEPAIAAPPPTVGYGTRRDSGETSVTFEPDLPPLRRSRVAAVLLLALFVAPAAARGQAPDAASLFARYNDRIVQVRLIDREAGRKAGLGTGFLVAEGGLIATNFHVVSEWVNHPRKYRIEYLDGEERTGDLELLDVDVVNDLALLRSDVLDREPLALPEAPPTRGDTIYSLGNPYDIGFTVIPGTYNGIDEGSWYEQIHFSGSINAGMSGGPALDAEGSVVGVNVATAGNQVSFLVPAAALHALVDQWRERPAPIEDFRARIREQLVSNQRALVGAMLERPWPTEPLGRATVVGELRPFVECWGDSSDEDELYKWASSSCRSSRQILLDEGFGTGVVAYQSFWLEPHELSWPRFRRQYEKLFGRFVPDNAAGEDDVTNYACEERFVHDDSGNVDKTVLCVRAYTEYPRLYDALYLRGSVDESDHAFVSHFTLSGVARESVAAFLARFQEVVQR